MFVVLFAKEEEGKLEMTNSNFFSRLPAITTPTRTLILAIHAAEKREEKNLKDD